MALSPPTRTLAGGACLAVLAGSGYAWALGTAPRADPGGTHILVVGSDSRAGLTAADKRRWHAGGAACRCADVIMVVHLSADGERAAVVSLPRDSYVPFARHDDGDGAARVHSGKLNAALRHGGPGLLTRTVERATGLDIDHYLQARFKGFVRAVDALGGATVCTKERMRDEHSGIDLTPGRHRLDGGGALKYVRTRHSGHGDIDRVRRQQRLVAGIAGRHLAAGTLAAPERLDALVGEVARGLRPGPGTSVADMLALAWQARRLKLRNVEFATVPLESISHPAGEWGSAVKWNEARARALFDRMEQDKKLAPADERGPRGGFDWTGRVAPGDRMDCD
ncbi:LCP family protein [Streptomyces sp. MAR4 CNX-425]|uniref:LCP family protein n=1 Tax=Streptomyces sp. MAR4 CNX-425 TaxID=3406343 RepID=UPI003B513E2F